MSSEAFDVIVIGSGPAGQNAAVQAAKGGRSVLVVERERGVGGECVHRGTIPSKTLREVAIYLSGLRQRSAGLAIEPGPSTKLNSLMSRLGSVLGAHENYMAAQLERSDVQIVRGRARFLHAHEIEVRTPRGGRETFRAETFVIATGSRPRDPHNVPLDHQTILDSDSLLSPSYLPESLIVLGAGVIASEWASIFQALGTDVTIIDKGERPMGFLDPELSHCFVEAFEAAGGTYLGQTRTSSVRVNRTAGATVELEDGSSLTAEKVLVALGRTACLDGLGLDALGLEPTGRGYLEVDDYGRTAVSHIYAVGDVVGPPALAAAAMEQGRRAMRHALGLEVGPPSRALPAGIFTIPEMACVGRTEEQARADFEGVLVGRARFDEVARGQINGATEGLLKLVVAEKTGELLGAHIVGEGAAELVHLAQIAILGHLSVHTFVEHVFNFPTLAEAYRVAALDVVAQLNAAKLAA